MGDALALEAVGVEVCEKPGGGDKQPKNPGFWRKPGELKHLSNQRKRKKNSIPLVAASETGIAQTERVSLSGL